MSRTIAASIKLLIAGTALLAVSPVYAAYDVAPSAQPAMQNEMDRSQAPNMPYSSPTVKSLGTIQEPQAEYGAPGMPPAMMQPTQNPGMEARGAEAPMQGLQPVQSGQVTYITGGIGDEERAQLDTIKKDYSLRVMSASKSGEFVGDTQIVIIDQKGNQLVSVNAGPLFFANLPDGTYTLKADTAGESKTQHFTIHKGRPASVHLGWR